MLGSRFVEFSNLLRQSFHQRKQTRLQLDGLRAQSHGEPFADFLANRAAVNAVDLNIVLRSGIRHHRSNLCGMEYNRMIWAGLA